MASSALLRACAEVVPRWIGWLSARLGREIGSATIGRVRNAHRQTAPGYGSCDTWNSNGDHESSRAGVGWGALHQGLHE